MAQTVSSNQKMVGEYVVEKIIGSGSFSNVWHARHRVNGAEVAIKEIFTSRLNSNTKLRESLKSEIVILKKINHPNIISFIDMIEDSGKIFIILEFCKGGDLSVYIQKRQRRIPEATAKHFMQQLASGLKVLREHNLIHRDLKPQNLLLSSNDDKAVLKIADFGFARSLQPKGLADTVCGSPLYMAPEVMQRHKYDAKADLWSVGTILFQLVIGKTPYTGANELQLLENIMKNELHFPSHITDLSPSCIDLCWKLLRRDPVARLTFDEFFNHPFLSQRLPPELSRNSRSERMKDGRTLSKVNPVRTTEQISQEDCLPFSLDDDSSGPDWSPSLPKRPLISTFGFSVDSKSKKTEVSNLLNRVDLTSNHGSSIRKSEEKMFNLGGFKGSLNEPLNSLDSDSKSAPKVVDRMELIEQDYVLVSSPPIDASSSASASNFPSKSGSPLQPAGSSNSNLSAPIPIISESAAIVGCIDSFESRSSAPGTSHGSTDMVDALEQPSTDCITRIKSLRRCALAITELVTEKIKAGKQLEAFSIQLVILAVWKQALHICHTQAASGIEGSPTPDNYRLREGTKEQGSPDFAEHPDFVNNQVSQDLCSHIERVFLLEVGNAEELAKVVEPGNAEMPDAMELIFQSALALGRCGAVDEYMSNTENAAALYSKAVQLFAFLLVEAPSLILNPPFSLTNSDRYRLQTYIDVLSNRQSISRSQKMSLLKDESQPLP